MAEQSASLIEENWSAEVSQPLDRTSDVHNTTDDKMRIVEHEHLTYEINEIITERVKASPPRNKVSSKNVVVQNLKLDTLNS